MVNYGSKTLCERVVYMDENKNPSEMLEEFNKLYLRYRRSLFRIVYIEVDDVQLTEDIVQEIFYEAWRHRETLVNHPNKKGWLYHVAKYKIMEYMRKAMKQEVCDVDPNEMEISVEESGYSKVEMDLMMCETLSQDELIRFQRYFILGEATAEIAEKENVTENNMRVRISRLKKKMEQTIRKNVE